jgi:hypothetical protein
MRDKDMESMLRESSRRRSARRHLRFEPPLAEPELIAEITGIAPGGCPIAPRPTSAGSRGARRPGSCGWIDFRRGRHEGDPQLNTLRKRQLNADIASPSSS